MLRPVRYTFSTSATMSAVSRVSRFPGDERVGAILERACADAQKMDTGPECRRDRPAVIYSDGMPNSGNRSDALHDVFFAIFITAG